MSGTVAVVLVASPLPQLDREFEYRIPEALADRVRPGVRVRVPVRSTRRLLDGYVLRVTDTPSYEGTLAELDDVRSSAPVLAPQVAALARELADRQAGTAADVVRLAVPARQARIEQVWCEAERVPAPIVDAHDAHAHVHAAIGPEWTAALTEEPGARVALRPSPGVEGGVPRAHALLADLATVHLARGRGSILAVPDYRDVELLLAALAPLNDTDAVLRFDGRVKPAARSRAFLRALEAPAIVVGTRAALYAPVASLGLIALLDDGDEMFAEPHAPYVHGRDVALARQRREGATLVLAGHAPSLESQRLVELGWLTELRAGGRSPSVRPTGAAIADEGPARLARIPPAAWRTARAGLERGPVLVQVARAGYVPSLVCASCRSIARCTRCGAVLGLVREGDVPSCHTCGARAAGWRCHDCGGERYCLGAKGVGRTADELGRAFPGVPVLVADGASERVRIEQRPSLVVATRGAEPVAPEGYAAVVLLDGERMLARESLDAGLDTLRWWSNAAALAADDALVVLVGAADGPGRALRDWRQAEAAASELAARRELAFPPAVRVGTVTGRHEEVERALAAVRELDGVRIDGPVPGEDGAVVATVRFTYASGPDLAKRLKAVLVKAATSQRPTRAGRPGAASTLRVHLDASADF